MKILVKWRRSVGLLTILFALAVWVGIVHYLSMVLFQALLFPFLIWTAISDRRSGVSRLPKLISSELAEMLIDEEAKHS